MSPKHRKISQPRPSSAKQGQSATGEEQVNQLLNSGRPEQALSLALDLLENNPDDISLLLLTGKIHQQQGNTEKVLSFLHRLIEQAPGHHQANLLLAETYHNANNNKVALHHIELAEQARPSHRVTLEQKGLILAGLYRYNKAIEVFENIIHQGSPSYFTWNNLGNQYRNLGLFSKAESCYLTAMELSGQDDMPYNNYLTFVHYLPDYSKEKIVKLYLDWEKRYTADIKKIKLHSNRKSVNKKIRLGMISDGFRTHPVGQMITSALEGIPPHEIEIYAYSTNLAEDHITQRIKNIAAKWMTVTHLDTKQLALQLVDDKIDILFDLCGHNTGSRMHTMAMKPAPILVKWVGGLINTTGLSTMDYLLSDAVETPEGEDRFYTEKLIRMPDDYICYNPPIYTPDINAPPARYNGYITLGCFNNPTKLNPVLLRQWARIMRSLPNSRLFLKGFQFSSDTLTNNIKVLLLEQGITEDRVTIEGPSRHEDLLKAYKKVDIALDPWPYSGGLTTCEAIYMGVPVVTLPGPTFAGRHSATHLTNAGMPQLVAEDWDQYHDIVLALASDLDNLANIRAHLRGALLASPVCDAQRFARNFSNAMRAIWQRHCEGKAPAALNLDKEGNACFEDEAEPVQLQLPEEPELFDGDDFRFRFNGKIVVLDHGAEFTCSDSFYTLHKLGVINTLCLDPGCRINNSQQLTSTGEFHHFPMTVLGDGSSKHLYVTLDPQNTRTLHFSPPDDFPEELKKSYDTLTKLPVNTVRIDDISDLEVIDWLILDNNHDILSILDNASKKLANTLIVQIKINFNFIKNEETDFGRLSSKLMEAGFIFHDFINKRYINEYSDDSSSLQSSADAVFTPSFRRLNQLSKNRALKLAFIADFYLQSPKLCTSILTKLNTELADAYNREKNSLSSPNVKSENLDVHLNTKNLNKKHKSTYKEKKLNWHLDDKISVVDIGANPIDGEPPYNQLLKSGKIKLVGFEPQQDALKKLNQSKTTNETYLSHAVGDGKEATLYICQASGMTSTLKPNFKVLNHFQGYPEWAKIKKTERIKTIRLDDLNEIKEIDWLKIDIQGGELAVFKNAENKLKNTLVIQTEVNFVQLYENQPLFAEIDQWMRANGFMLHTFLDERKRLYYPLVINGQIHQGINQITTADAVYVKDINKLNLLPSSQKLKMAYILHHVYGSYDLSLKLLREVPGFDLNGYLSSIEGSTKKQTSDINKKIDQILEKLNSCSE